MASTDVWPAYFPVEDLGTEFAIQMEQTSCLKYCARQLRFRFAPAGHIKHGNIVQKLPKFVLVRSLQHTDRSCLNWKRGVLNSL